MEIRNSHLFKRGRIYYFRIKVPEELVKLVKITEIKHSTGVEDLAQALSLAKLWTRKMQGIFAQAETGDMDEKQIKRMLDDYFSAEFRRIREIRLGKIYADDEEKKGEIEELEADKAELIGNFHSNNLLSVSGFVDRVYAFFDRPVPDKKSSEYLLFCSKAFNTVYKRDNAEIEMINGNFDEPVVEDIAELKSESSRATVIKAPDVKTVKSLYEEYRAEKVRSKAWEGKTLRTREGVFKLFFGVFGEDRSVKSFTHADLKMFRDEVLSKMPSNYTKHEKYKGKSYTEILAIPAVKTLSISTINDDLNIITSFYKWCIQHEYADKNPASGLNINDNRRDDEKRSAYTSEDLQQILKSLPYDSDVPFKTLIPIIGMFSGMRQTEICQLHLEDVREVEGILCFDINANADDKDVKSKAAVRTVPVHPALCKMEFPEYLKHLIDKKEKRLWPELEYLRDGYGQTFQRWYGRFNRKLFPEDLLKCFHSMRHSFITNLKLKGVEDTAIMELVGHTNPSMTTGRYGKRFPPPKLLEAIKKLDYGFDPVKVVKEAMKKAK